MEQAEPRNTQVLLGHLGERLLYSVRVDCLLASDGSTDYGKRDRYRDGSFLLLLFTSV